MSVYVIAKNSSYLIDVLKGIEDVVRQTRQQVHHEPALEVVRITDQDLLHGKKKRRGLEVVIKARCLRSCSRSLEIKHRCSGVSKGG